MTVYYLDKNCESPDLIKDIEYENPVSIFLILYQHKREKIFNQTKLYIIYL